MEKLICESKKILERNGGISLEIHFEFLVEEKPTDADNIACISVVFLEEEFTPFDTIEIMDWLKAALYPYAETLLSPQTWVEITVNQLRVVADSSWELPELEQMLRAELQAQMWGLPTTTDLSRHKGEDLAEAYGREGASALHEFLRPFGEGVDWYSIGETVEALLKARPDAAQTFFLSMNKTPSGEALHGGLMMTRQLLENHPALALELARKVAAQCQV